jgi:hypothetical protein
MRNVWWTNRKCYHTYSVRLDFPLPFVVLTMLHSHISWDCISSYFCRTKWLILPHSYDRESISLSSCFSFSLIHVFWVLRNYFVEWYNFRNLLPWSEAPHVFNHGTRRRCVLNINRPNGSHVPRFKELFAAGRDNAVPPTCKHGHLKRK